MIPKLVHHTWKTAEIGYWVFQKGQRSVREHLAHWQYRLWTDSDLESFVREEYPSFYLRWRALDRKIKRVDTSRYFLLHKYGGLYADLDFIFTRSIDELLEEADDLCFYQSTQARVKQWTFLGNALLLSRPGHPFWLGTLEYMLTRPPATAVLHHTGPFALGSYFESLAVKPPAKIFGPEIFDNERGAEGVGERRYGYHVRCATWQQPGAEG